MNKYEEEARKTHKQGNNCSYSVYMSFIEDYKLSGDIPAPRSEQGKCGAVLATEKILKEIGKENLIDKYEKEFISEFNYLTCADLMKKDRRCNDYVGKSAKFLSNIYE